jgi:hypothetical protein
MMESIEPFLLMFAVSGVGLMLGLWLVLLPAIGQMSALVFPHYYDVGIGVPKAKEEASGD